MINNYTLTLKIYKYLNKQKNMFEKTLFNSKLFISIFFLKIFFEFKKKKSILELKIFKNLFLKSLF